MVDVDGVFDDWWLLRDVKELPDTGTVLEYRVIYTLPVV
jgi:hypothetical protein